MCNCMHNIITLHDKPSLLNDILIFINIITLHINIAGVTKLGSQFLIILHRPV
jgi:hypothetical protein